MKKVLAIVLMLAMVLSVVGCQANDNANVEPTQAPATSAVPATTEPTAAPVDSTEPAEAKGSVYYLNFKPEADAAWQALAKEYTELTGVPVQVVTAASGTYEETLTAEMDKSSMPTLFQCGNEASLATWGDYCLDLKDTDVYKEMNTDDFNLFGENGEVYCIAYCYESYGLIVNKALLEKAGHQVSEITNFETLKAVVEDITARKDELGFSAFSSAGLDSSSSWRFSGHLTNLPLFYEFRDDNVTSQPATVTGKYLDNFKNIWDLYINNSTCAPSDLPSKTAGDSEAEFAQGKAVFFQNGSWEYNNLVGEGKFTDDDLAMMPIYIGVGDEANQGLCTGTENFWCVNKNAKPEDIQATLDFMYWCISSETGTKAMAEEMGFVIPFKNAQESPNLFVKQDAEMTAAGKTPVSWNFATIPSEEWKKGLSTALTMYAADQSDANWDGVKSAFVDNWAVEYQLTHEG